jgi:hypothetical protein
MKRVRTVLLTVLAGVVGLVVLALMFPGEPAAPEPLCERGREMMADGASRETVEAIGACDSRKAREAYEILRRERYGS